MQLAADSVITPANRSLRFRSLLFLTALLLHPSPLDYRCLELILLFPLLSYLHRFFESHKKRSSFQVIGVNGLESPALLLPV